MQKQDQSPSFKNSAVAPRNQRDRRINAPISATSFFQSATSPERAYQNHSGNAARRNLSIRIGLHPISLAMKTSMSIPPDVYFCGFRSPQVHFTPCSPQLLQGASGLTCPLPGSLRRRPRPARPEALWPKGRPPEPAQSESAPAPPISQSELPSSFPPVFPVLYSGCPHFTR